MAFTLAQASQGSGTYALPLAPQLRAAYRRALRRRIAAVAALWTLLFVCGFAVLLALLLTDAAGRIGLSETARWIAVCLVPSFCVVAALVPGRDVLHHAAIRSLGYCRATGPSAGGPYERIPASLSGLSRGLLAAAAAAAAPVGLLVMAIAADPEPWAVAAGTVVALVLAALLGLTAVKRLRIAASGWREECGKLEAAEQVRLTGEHVVARVAESGFTGSWLNGLPVFRIRVEFVAGGQTRRASFRYVEFPRWAPAPGNEFDLWFDRRRPDDPERIVLERRLVGQEFAEDPESFRRPARGSDGPGLGPLEPPWATSMSGLTGVQRAAYAGSFGFGAGAILCQAVITACWFSATRPPWWVVATLMLGFLPGPAGLWLRLRAAVAPKAVIRSTGASLVPALVGVLGMVLSLVLAGEVVWAMAVSEPFTGMAGEAGVLAIFAALIGGFLVLLGGLAFETPVSVAFASNPRVPPEVVQEALRSGDPACAVRLERERGYTVGPLHLDAGAG